MRVLLVSVSTPAHALGGMERHLVLLTRALRKLGHEVDWLTTPLPAGRPAQPPDGTLWHQAEGAPPSIHGPAWWAASARTFQALQARRGYGAVISEAMSAYGLAGLPGLPPLLVVAHGFEPEHLVNRWQEVRGPWDFLRYALRGAPETLAYSWREYRLVSRARLVLSVAPHVARKLSTCYKVPAAKLIDFPNWLEDGALEAPASARSELRRRLEIEEGAFVFLFAGVLSRQKGARIALEAFDEHAFRTKTSHLIFAGDGEEMTDLRVDTMRFGRLSRVHFLGAVAPEDMPGVYAAADAFLMPTLRIEGMPYALLEAAAAGLPCAATRKGGNGGVLGAFAHWVAPGSAAELTAAVDKLAGDPAAARALGAKARERVRSVYGEAAALDRLRSALT